MASSYNPLDLSGKLILVTGASSGIGRAAAIALSRLGARVVLAGRREPALAETLDCMERRGTHATERIDLSEIDAIPAWLKSVVQRVGAPLDGLVHSAGVSKYAPLRVVARGHIDEIMLPNVYASLALLRGATARDVSRAGSSLVFLSSVASLTGSPGMVTYSASKGAINAMVRSAASELRAKRIRVNCVAPAFVETPMLDEARASVPGTAERNEARQFLGLIPPEDVAISIAYLLSDAARTVTGTTLVIDGGYTC